MCYRFDEKWNPGHRCKRKGLAVLATCDEDDVELGEEGKSEEIIDPEVEIAELNQVIEVSLHGCGAYKPENHEGQGQGRRSRGHGFD